MIEFRDLGGFPVTVASYNIHRCFGTDRKYLPERIGDVLLALGADIIGLQEVDMRLLVDGRPQLEYLAETLDMAAIAGANFHDHRGHFGNAMLTRLPILSMRRTDLSVRNFEPRGALEVIQELHGRRLRVMVTHLGLNAAERRLQVRRLLAVLEDGEDMPTVVMGDFNEWKPTGGALRSLNRRFGPSLAARTFPSRLPLLSLD
ncbi:MAG: endonuclease/exonuclease/phosphatase family protein, partial [Rhodospirillales bacterium]|nr:endonuclease/exonuclease/phosphatase family protein [Rhodospirillales bacterium]